ncbi:MAG: SulP family inorganic anion transporter [Candidatus Kapaibacteriales bacterium]
MPLCLGIALASGVPPVAGIITAIIGGLFTSLYSGNHISISGPAAGLIVVTLGAAASMGGAGAEAGFAGYPHALGAIAISGILMLAFGILKLGKFGNLFPSSVVQGMLAAIGLIIIIKQIFPAAGLSSPDASLLGSLLLIPEMAVDINPNSLVIAGVTIAILAYHKQTKIKAIEIVPAAVWVLLITIPLAILLSDGITFLSLPEKLWGGESGLQFPSFELISTAPFWQAVITFTLVSSIETLLSTKAISKLDPEKRAVDLDKDLNAMGAGSTLASFAGGLPMISEILRSSANVGFQAKSMMANMYHGLFLVVYLFLAKDLLELIPIPTLSGMLLYAGYGLASPQRFKNIASVGRVQFMFFIVTLLSVLATNLLTGIGIGIFLKIVTLFYYGAKPKDFFNLKSESRIKDGSTHIDLKGNIIFTNSILVNKTISEAANNYDRIEIDLSNARMIDHSAISNLYDQQRIYHNNSIEISITGLQNTTPQSAHPLAARLKK